MGIAGLDEHLTNASEWPPRRRLDQAHRLWHQALASYPHVDDFCLAVNALLQALRSTTWVLQKTLAHVNGFDQWYADQQALMAADPLMRWAVEARNHIEKQGDLEMRSTARVSVVASWLPAPYDELEVPPLVGPAQIAEQLAVRDYPERVRKDGVLVVERRWVTVTLPDRELLDACAHVYSVLDHLLVEAEARFAADGSDAGHPARQVRPGCMVAGRDERTARLNLRTGAFLEYEPQVQPEPTFADLEKAGERYGLPMGQLAVGDTKFPTRARRYHDVGRTILQKDGYHVTVVFMFREGVPVASVTLAPEDQQDKYVLMSHLAEDAITLGADEIVLSTEVWLALLSADPSIVDLRAAERSDRMEGFTTESIARGASGLSLVTPFSRVDGNIVLGETFEEVGDPLSLVPIRDAWRKRGYEVVDDNPEARR